MADTEQGGRSSAAVWSDPGFARAWLDADPRGAGDLLELPRRMAAALVAEETPEPRLVVDIASGPGTFLSVLLDASPGARGVWLDVSPTMLEQARTDLARFGERVDFRTGDMTDLRGAPGGAEVVLTSRASHHLSPSELRRFYREAAGLLAPGGWLVNLDHVAPDEAVWERRYRSARKRFVPHRPNAGTHHHDRPLPRVGDHLEGYRASGIAEVDIAWKAFHTCLFMGRAAGA